MTAARGPLAVLSGLVVLCCFSVAACGGESDPQPAVESSPAAASVTEQPGPGASGCAATDQPPAGDSERTLRFGELDRTYILHVPPSYDGSSPVPLVLNFHGFGSNGRQQANYSRFPAEADEEGFIVVSPNGGGSPQQWNVLRSGNLPDDIAFVRGLIDALEAELCIDAERVFAAGMSNGAAFAQQVACAMPERIAAVAAVTAVLYPATCASELPIAVIGFHGTEDVCVPYAGGPATCGSYRGPLLPVEESAKNWARHNGCNLTPSAARLSPNVRTLAYSECDGETAVVLFTIEGGGHTWPGSVAVGRLGETTDEIDATEQIWQFFAGQANLRAGDDSR